MAAIRKQQAAVDRTMKRINEGVLWFSSMWEKMEGMHPTVRSFLIHVHVGNCRLIVPDLSLTFLQRVIEAR